MKTLFRLLIGLLVVAAIAAAVAVSNVIRHGVSARDEPTAAEAFLARRLRHLAIPRAARDAANPVPVGPEALARARGHFADHCASCHGNDGKGQTTLGRNMYPKAPDMTLAETQNLSDGEIFSIIENGVRLTGMPAWGGEGSHDTTESWDLVHLIRHLPQITPEELAEMESLNPKSRKELEEEERIRRFLAGEDVETPGRPGSHAH